MQRACLMKLDLEADVTRTSRRIFVTLLQDRSTILGSCPS